MRRNVKKVWMGCLGNNTIGVNNMLTVDLQRKHVMSTSIKKQRQKEI